MTRSIDIDQVLDDWLGDGPSRLPDRVVASITADIQHAAPTRRWRLPWRNHVYRNFFALAGAAVIVVVAAGLALSLLVNPPSIAGPLPTTSPSATALPSTSPAPAPSQTAEPSPSAPFDPFNDKWPQRTATEMQDAQDRADAGDPGYTWQLDQQEVIDRFLRELLGWDEFMKNGYLSDDYEYTVSGDEAANRMGGQVWMRCAPGKTNPLYPSRTEASGGDRCAPTIDDLRYEAVTLTPWTFGRRGSAGVWTVTASDAPPTTVTQVDPRAVTARLEEFLNARIAREAAEGYVDVDGGRGRSLLDEVPLLYATTSGAPYERFEIEPVGDPRWPYAEMEFKVRLFANDGATVVEQPIGWDGSGLRSNVLDSTENGQPVAVPYGFLGGEVTLSAADPWMVGHQDFLNAALGLNNEYGEERLAFIPDPLPVAAGCEAGAAPADAAALAKSILSDQDFEATAPVEVVFGGAVGLQMDITVAPGASVCAGRRDEGLPLVVTSTRTNICSPICSRFDVYAVDRDWGSALDQGSVMRLYLFDRAEGSKSRILAIAIVAPEGRFDEVLEAASPVLDSIEFHTP
jgi:hypothetical protein